MFIILSLIVVVAAFNITGLTILIKNKTKEITILKTLGLSNKSIKNIFSHRTYNRFFCYSLWCHSRILFSINIEKINFYQPYLI